MIQSFCELYSICQRYNFESNLQLVDKCNISYYRCIRYVKDTILKAIYNTPPLTRKSASAVFDMSKIQFWKQFTTTVGRNSYIIPLYSICQRYNFESNLQPANVSGALYISCIRYVKDTILKAIYNAFGGVVPLPRAVFDMSKIQFWKQFTTYIATALYNSWLYSICQRYNFESNLQLWTSLLKSRASCIRYVKDTILKAIYNQSGYLYPQSSAVFDMSKIQFWKQFTTRDLLQENRVKLYSICQRYNFESNLQRKSYPNH